MPCSCDDVVGRALCLLLVGTFSEAGMALGLLYGISVTRDRRGVYCLLASAPARRAGSPLPHPLLLPLHPRKYPRVLQNEDLLTRCTDAESRCQELSSAVPDSTRPLLRQIESLHANFAEKTRVWEQVEVSLRQVRGCGGVVCGCVGGKGDGEDAWPRI